MRTEAAAMTSLAPLSGSTPRGKGHLAIILVPITIHSVAAQVRAALESAIEIYRRDGARIHLLNVQPPVSGYAARFFDTEELARLQEGVAREELAPACATLDAAGVPYWTHVEVGRSAETIVKFARLFYCDRILMGPTEETDYAEKLFGTLDSQVRHLMSLDGSGRVIGF
jgi:nucleotide-binding universal stress UspA family protein